MYKKKIVKNILKTSYLDYFISNTNGNLFISNSPCIIDHRILLFEINNNANFKIERIKDILVFNQIIYLLKKIIFMSYIMGHIFTTRRRSYYKYNIIL